jgi:hypothetical protein
VPILGCVFKKSYYNGQLGHNVSELVLPQDLVVSYRARSVEDAPRKTHVIYLDKNDIYERCARGVFVDVREETWFEQPARQTSASESDNRQGTHPSQSDETTPYECYEQHVQLDLDKDGYAEPYIITVEPSSGSLLRLVSAIDRPEDITRGPGRRIVSIRRTEYFTKIPFIPSPDGGIYDLGFGVLLGPLNESVSTIINQLVDAGTMATTAGGFLGQGAKMKGGTTTFTPLEWKRVESTGDDLRKNIVPLEVREPSAVLLQLLTLLIEYTQRIGGATDTMSGENPGQNTKVGTVETMVEQGEKIYSGIFKRIWRGMKGEFAKCARLNSIHLPDRFRYGPGDAYVLREDYLSSSVGVVPVADPHISSDSIRVRQALIIAERAATTLGYDKDYVEKNLLRALRIENIDKAFPGSKGMEPPKDPRIAAAEINAASKEKETQAKMQMQLAQLLEERGVKQANITKLMADAAFAMESAGGVREGNQVAQFEARIAAARTEDDKIARQIELLLQQLNADADRDLERELAEKGDSDD